MYNHAELLKTVTFFLDLVPFCTTWIVVSGGEVDCRTGWGGVGWEGAVGGGGSGSSNCQRLAW